MIRALTSSALSGVIRTALQFVTLTVLASVNGAGDYGLYALALPFAILASIVFDAGFGPLVVRPATIQAHMVASLHALALAVGCAAVLLLWGLSFAVPLLFADPRLPGALRVMSVVPLLGLVAAVPRALLEREMRYDSIAKVEVAALAVASLLAFAAAAIGAGVWSLFTLSVVQAAMRCGGFNLLQRVSLAGRLGDLREIYHQGKWITLQNIQVYINRNSDNLLVGWAFGSAALGLYALAYQVVIVPLQAVAWPFGAVLLSQLRRLGSDAQRTEAVNGVVTLTLWVIAPGLSAAAVLCPELVQLFLKASWQPLPPLVQLLCASAVFQTLASFYGTVLVSQGALRRNFLVGLVNTACLLALFVLSVAFLDLVWMVRLYTLYSAALGLVLLGWTYRAFGARLTKAGGTLLPPLLLALLIAAAGLVVAMAAAGAPPQLRLAFKAAAVAVLLGIAGWTQRRRLRHLLSNLAGPAAA